MSALRHAWVHRATAGERWWLRATVVTAVAVVIQFLGA